MKNDNKNFIKPYLRYDNMNVKIPRFALKEFGETKEFTLEQLKSYIEYAKNKPKTSPKSTSPKSTSPKVSPKPKASKTKK